MVQAEGVLREGLVSITLKTSWTGHSYLGYWSPLDRTRNKAISLVRKTL